MFRKRKFILIAFIIIIPFILSACGNDGGGLMPMMPNVSVADDPDGKDDNDPGGIGTETDTIPQVILISPNDDGEIPINGETLEPSDYDSTNPDATVIAVDEDGTELTVTIDEDGNIIVHPADGTVDGTYTVIIETGETDCEVIITVIDGIPTVTSAVTMPADHAMVLNMNEGTIILPNGETLTITSDSILGGFDYDSEIANITVLNENNTAIDVLVYETTGDLVTAGEGSGPYTIIITTSDGSVIRITTDDNGTITAITEQNSSLLLNLNDGSLTWEDTTLTITDQGPDGIWTLPANVEILSATAADGTITIDTDNIWINRTNGDIMLTGIDPSTPMAGPYEIKISIDGQTYIIQADAAGNIIGILPGNTLLALSEGFITYCGNNILSIAQQAGGNWSISDAMSDLSATDANGNAIDIQISSVNGNIVTANSFTDPVTIIFNYTDSNGNVITYTLIVANGSLISYQAMITEPGPDFDFSTVTQIKVTLKAVDEKSGLPVGQASINFVNKNSTHTWEGFTNNDGLSVFEATVETANKTARVMVNHSAYETIDCEITGIGKLIEFGRKISMKAIEDAPVVDTDGDGVPDEDDDFPTDPNAAKEITGVYTLAFEDRYPSKGDADFNDLVVKLTITEKIDSKNRLRQINLATRLLASGAGYSNQFAITINNKQYILISDPKADTIYTLGSHSNARRGTAYHECTELVHDPILFEGGVDRNSIAPMPYDPYILCNGNESKQSHLPFVETGFTGNVIDSDGFPWAILVPSDWAWPYESSGSTIFRAYPEFDDWYLNDGEISPDWYLNPNSYYVYTR